MGEIGLYLQAVVVLGIVGFITYTLIKAFRDKSEREAEWINNVELDFVNSNVLEWVKQEYALAEKVNEFRIENGKNPLEYSDVVYKGATIRGDYMVIQNDISHAGFPNVVAMLTKSGLDFIGENLAHGYTYPANAFKSWLNSEDHKAVMLGNWKYTGVYITEDKEGKKVYCQLFAR